jgi:hypothetical protein
MAAILFVKAGVECGEECLTAESPPPRLSDRDLPLEITFVMDPISP